MASPFTSRSARRRARRFSPVAELLEARIQLDGGVRFAAGIGVKVPASVPNSEFPAVRASSSAQAVDAAGNVYVAGSWSSGDLQFGAPAAPTLAGSLDDLENFSFVAKYAPDGGLVWARSFEPRSHGASGGNSSVAAVALDGQGGLYLTGSYSNSVDFDPGPGEAVLDGGASMYLLRLTGDGALSWVHKLGDFQSEADVDGGLLNAPRGMAVDDLGRVYVTGSFLGVTVDFDPGPGSAQLASNSNWGSTFIVQYNADGSLGWAKVVAGSGASTSHHAAPTAIAAVPGGGVAVAGEFRGLFDFDPGAGTVNHSAAADAIYLLRLDASGNFVWADVLAQAAGNNAYLTSQAAASIAVDHAGSVYIVGIIGGPMDFDPGAGATILSPAEQDYSNAAAYFAKFDSVGAIVWARTAPESPGVGLTLDELDRPIVAGRFPNFRPRIVAAPDVLPANAPDALLLLRLDPMTGRVTASRKTASAVFDVGSLARGSSGALSIIGTYTQAVTIGSTTLAPISSTRPPDHAESVSGFVALLDPIADPPPAAALQLDPASDTGPSNQDGITSAPILSFWVGSVAPGAYIELYASTVMPGADPARPGFGLVGSRIGPGLITGVGTVDGSVRDVVYRVQIVDPARGYSPFSNPVAVRQDRQGPDQPSQPLEFFSFTPGVSPRVRPGAVLTGFGGESGGSVQLLDQAGNVLAVGTVSMSVIPGDDRPRGQYRITVPTNLSGYQTLSIRALDALGNPSAATTPTTVLIAASPEGGSGNNNPGGAAPGSAPRIISAVIVKKKGKQFIVLTFDRDLAPQTVRTKGNYVLRGAGKDRRYNTRDDARLKVKSVVHDAARRTVTLTPSKAIARNLPFRLAVQGLAGVDGTSIAGLLETNFGPPPRG